MIAAERYAKEVLEGKIIVGKWIKLACKRYLDDLLRDDLIFDEQSASRAVNFIERKLCHWEDQWAGKPLILEDWQKFIVQQIFGWKNKSDGLRRVRSVYVQIARKNGKTSFAAAILLYHLFADKTGTPQILVGANNEDQAKICVNAAGRMIENSDELSDLVHDGEVKLSIYRENIFNIHYPGRDGVVKAISKNPETKDGFNPSLGVIDEYHEARDSKLLKVIKNGQGSRSEPLLIAITTAGFNKEGPCYSILRERSVQVLEHGNDDDHLAFIYEQDPEDDWQDPLTWVKSNPNWNVSVFERNIKSLLNDAVKEGGQSIVDFKTKNLNMWVDAPVVWISTETWNTNRHGFDTSILDGKLCYGGLDLARTVDLNAFVLWFPNFDGEKHAVLPFFWIPESKAANNNDRVDYQRWIDKGYMFKTKGNVADYKQIAQNIKDIIQKYEFKSLAYDKYLTGHGVLADLLDNSIDCHELGQNIVTLNMPTKELERIVTSGQLEHFGNPVLTWMMGNTLLARDTSGNVKPDKGKSEKKIDGVSAMINALAEFKTFEGQNQEIGILYL